MEIILGVLISCFESAAEMFLQVIFQFLAEFMGVNVAGYFRRSTDASPTFSAIGYLLYGTLVGGVGFLLIPNLFILPHWVRIANLILTPIVCGMIMASWGKHKRRFGRKVIKLDSFWYGFLFALAMVSSRYVLQLAFVYL